MQRVTQIINPSRDRGSNQPTIHKQTFMLAERTNQTQSTWSLPTRRQLPGRPCTRFTPKTPSKFPITTRDLAQETMKLKDALEIRVKLLVSPTHQDGSSREHTRLALSKSNASKVLRPWKLIRMDMMKSIPNSIPRLWPNHQHLHNTDL